MRDRLSTKILSNGATRYGVYDETGNLLRYEYIKLEDEPTVEGDLFSKANMLPDSIPALLGLKMANPQVKDALNVLANIGNVHVWQRVQTYADPVPEVPAGYTLGAVETDVQLFTATSSKDSNRFCNAYYSKKLAVSNDGTVALANESTAAMYANTSGDNSRFAGAFVKLFGGSYSDSFIDYLFYIPEDSVLTAEQATGPSNWRLTASKLQRVIGYPYTPAIPAGTTTDYLTSTDRNAYPDQSAAGGQDAYYTLGDVDTSGYYLGPTYAYRSVPASTSLSVSENGTIELNNPTNIVIDEVTIDSVQVLTGKFIRWTMYADAPIVFIPTDAQAVGVDSSNIKFDKYQPVTGHAAIPANTTITYLGRLGEKTQMAHVYYIGTGTETSESNPLSLTFPFPPKIVLYVGRYEAGKTTNSSTNQYFYPTSSSYTRESCHILMDVLTSSYKNNLGFGYYSSSYPLAKKSNDGKTVYWYAISTNDNPGNDSGVRYDYIAIG